MDKKNNDYILQIMSTIIAIISVLASTSLLFTVRQKNDILILIICMVAFLIEVALIFMTRLRANNKAKEIYTLNKLIEYSKKRKELEEEINLLTRELIHSNLSEYLDVNRLVFAGQNQMESNRGMNYNSFLMQFGLINEKMEMRKNSAVFLTPFNDEGEKLFSECQKILSRIDIFLQKTDNYVEKEDIMMNIILLIIQSEIVIVNINGRNPNVYYELGIAHAIGKPTILLSETNFSLDDIGFDIRQKRIIMYRSKDDLEKQLLYQVSRLKSKEM